MFESLEKNKVPDFSRGGPTLYNIRGRLPRILSEAVSAKYLLLEYNLEITIKINFNFNLYL